MKAAAALLLAGSVFLGVGSSRTPAREGDGGPAIRATIDQPDRLVFDAAGNLFIYEASDDLPPVIREIPVGTQTIRTVLVGCDRNRYPTEEGDCLGPVSELRVVGNDRLLVTEFTDNRMRTFDLRSKRLSLLAGNGSLKSSGDGGLAIAAGIVDPRCAAVDQLGNVFVCDGHRIRRVDAQTGIITTVAGSGRPGFGGDHGPALDAQLEFPLSIAVDPAGNLFIADDTSQRIRRVDKLTGIIETIAGTGRESRFFGFDITDGPALKTDLFEPRDLLFDRQGNLLFLNEYDRVCKVDLGSGRLTVIAGRGKRGRNPGYDGDGRVATRAHIDAWGMALDPQGNLFLADTEHNRIRRVDAGTRVITTIAGNGKPHGKPGGPIL